MFDDLFSKASAVSSLLGDTNKLTAMAKLLPLLKDLPISQEQVSTISSLAQKELNLPAFLNPETITTLGEMFSLVEKLINSSETKKEA